MPPLLFPLLLPLPPPVEPVLLVELVVEPPLVELALVVPPLDVVVVPPLDVLLEVLVVVPLELELVVEDVVLPLELLPLLPLDPFPLELLLDEVVLLLFVLEPDEVVLLLELPLDPPDVQEVADALLIYCAWQFISVFTALPSAKTPMDIPPPSSSNSKAYSTAEAPRSSLSKDEMTPVMSSMMHN